MARYHIRRVKFQPEEYDGDGIRPYGIWDTEERVYVNKWGRPDAAYWCVTREIAEMRRRDLNHYADMQPLSAANRNLSAAWGRESATRREP